MCRLLSARARDVPLSGLVETVEPSSDRRDAPVEHGKTPSQPEENIVAARRGVLAGAFALLEELGRVGEARLTDLAVDAGIPKATAHRLLSQLATLGAVEQWDGRYRIGPKIAHLGLARYHHRLLGRASALPLRDLTTETGATVCVVAPSAAGMTVVNGIRGAGSEAFPHLPGQTLPRDSAADVLFTAFGSAADPPLGYSTAQWTRRLSRAREQGADVHEYEWDGERICLATPVHTSSGRIVAAVGVAIVDPRHLPEAVESAQRAARMLSVNVQRLPSPRHP